MKRTITLAVLSCIACCGFTKPAAIGIYLNAHEFNARKLAFARSGDGVPRIRLNEFFASPYVTIIDGSARKRIPKDSIFGYRSGDGTTYRFFRRESYQVLNAGALPLLYKRTQLQGGRGPRISESYYFSKDATSPLLLLTRGNIRSLYSTDSSFVDAVYDTFNTDANLVQYDTYRRIYKLNKLYNNLHSLNR